MSCKSFQLNGKKCQCPKYSKSAMRKATPLHYSSNKINVPMGVKCCRSSSNAYFLNHEIVMKIPQPTSVKKNGEITVTLPSGGNRKVLLINGNLRGISGLQFQSL